MRRVVSRFKVFNCGARSRKLNDVAGLAGLAVWTEPETRHESTPHGGSVPEGGSNYASRRPAWHGDRGSYVQANRQQPGFYDAKWNGHRFFVRCTSDDWAISCALRYLAEAHVVRIYLRGGFKCARRFLLTVSVPRGSAIDDPGATSYLHRNHWHGFGRDTGAVIFSVDEAARHDPMTRRAHAVVSVHAADQARLPS